MAKNSYVRGLMSFNRRVLSLGSIDHDTVYAMEDLRDKLWFNKIFINNMQEVFQKYDCRPIIENYIEALDEYHRNISMIRETMEIIDPTIRIEDYSSFEQRLVARSVDIDNQLVFSGVGTYSFRDDIIYYISCTTDVNGDDKFIIFYVDPKRSVYHQIISFDYDTHTIFWKSDDMIMNHIPGNCTVAIRVTSRKNGNIIKVECNGSIESMKKIVRLFPPSALILSNRYIYTDDIERIIESRIRTVPVKFEQERGAIDLTALFTKDMLIEYPTTSFDAYLDFLSKASTNPDIKSIYLSLYRIGKNPAIYNILKNAVQRGIYVHVNIELNASGEYNINRFWMTEMRSIGVYVTTAGFDHRKSSIGRVHTYKVHSKLTLVSFKDGRSIAQIGTGNYHSQTTSQYTDLSIITADREICHQIMNLFDLFRLYGKASRKNYSFKNKNFLVTQFNARDELKNLVEHESELGRDGYIAIKCNSLDDSEFNKSLDRAAKKGCNIDLIVRGVCTWVPDQIGSNVMIKSIVWDKLEHSRVYCFGRVDPTMYIGSLDPVTDKFDKRIETLVRVKDPYILRRLGEYMNNYITHSENSWKMLRSGEYIKEV